MADIFDNLEKVFDKEPDWNKIRIEIAAKALQGILSNPDVIIHYDNIEKKYEEVEDVTKTIAKASCIYADALIEELKKITY